MAHSSWLRSFIRAQVISYDRSTVFWSTYILALLLLIALALMISTKQTLEFTAWTTAVVVAMLALLVATWVRHMFLVDMDMYSNGEIAPESEERLAKKARGENPYTTVYHMYARVPQQDVLQNNVMRELMPRLTARDFVAAAHASA